MGGNLAAFGTPTSSRYGHCPKRERERERERERQRESERERERERERKRERERERERKREGESEREREREKKKGKGKGADREREAWAPGHHALGRLPNHLKTDILGSWFGPSPTLHGTLQRPNRRIAEASLRSSSELGGRCWAFSWAGGARHRLYAHVLQRLGGAGSRKGMDPKQCCGPWAIDSDRRKLLMYFASVSNSAKKAQNWKDAG